MNASWHIGEILIQKKLIDWKQLEDALIEQKKTQEFVGEVLVRKQYVPRFLLFKALAERHAMPFADLSHVFVDGGAVRRVPKSVALKYRILPIEVQDRTLVVGVSDPLQDLPVKEIAELAQVAAIKTVLCTPEAVETAIETYYGGEPMAAGAGS